MSKSESTSIQPKSIRQKRILDIAADNPGATLAEIAEQVPSVSADHVDRVLDQYGDPAESGDSSADDSSSGASDPTPTGSASSDSQDSPDETSHAEATDQPAESTSESGGEPGGLATAKTPVDTSTMDPDTETEPTEPVVAPENNAADGPTETTESDASNASPTGEATPSPEDLTQKERETLRAIAYEPTATQAEIANMLSISRATVSNRVNAIPGFDWADRGSFVDEVFDEHLTVDAPVNPGDDANATVTQNAGKEAVTDGAPSAQSDEVPTDSLPEASPTATGNGVVDGQPPSTAAAQTADRDDATTGSAAAPGEEFTAISRQLDDFAQRLAAVEAELRDEAERGDSAAIGDTDLLHKVVYACMNSDRITEEEELQILDTLVE